MGLDWLGDINFSLKTFLVLDNYMSRCKCTDGDSRGGIGLVGGHQFFSENISSYQYENRVRSITLKPS